MAERLTEDHLRFCATGHQENILRLKLDGLSNKTISETVGCTTRNVEKALRRIRTNAVARGYEPEAGRNSPQALPVAGTSTLYRKAEDGSDTQVLRWEKTSASLDAQKEHLREVVEAMAEDIKPIAPTAPPDGKVELSDDLLNLHVITDTHIGMFANDSEGGESWNSEKAEAFLARWLAVSIWRAPPARRGVLLCLGDILHTDGLMPVTPASGHVLDADLRYGDMVRMAIRTVRRGVEEMLKRYIQVDMVIVGGNHDPGGSIWLRELFILLYADEPRINVLNDQGEYAAIEHGGTALFFHHGHRKTPNKIDVTFTSMFREIYGRATNCYGHVGHRHSKVLIEGDLMSITQHDNIVPTDAYAAQSGYRSTRSAEVITYSKRFGEVGSQRSTPELVEELSS